MFVQVIEGKTVEPERLRRQLELWVDEMSADADGYLGTTGGISDDGRAVFLARFESAEAARRNSDRPEQGAWWHETMKCFDGDISVRNSEEVDLLLDGGTDDAGFVQIIQGVALDKERLRALERAEVDRMRAVRPDLLGGITVWDGDAFTQAAYFSNEEDARRGEASMGDADAADWQSLVADVTFIDLTDPWLRTR